MKIDMLVHCVERNKLYIKMWETLKLVPFKDHIVWDNILQIFKYVCKLSRSYGCFITY